MRYIFLTALLCFQLSSFAQSKYYGSWQGTLNVGKELKVIFTITAEKDKTFATLAVPEQGASGIKSSELVINKDSLKIVFDQAKVTYLGVLKDDTHIEGKWKQNGLPFPLNLEKTDKAFEYNRPQNPQPPYSYNSEDIIYHNADQSIKYGATITTPKDDEKHPAIILISGSGQQNRDEEIFGHKPFAVIADHLTKNGYVVLRVDDRGMNETTGDLSKATSADFAIDVMVSLDYLKTRKEVDVKKIGLLGHSEGGMIAPLVAAQRPKDIDFIILTAGPGVKVTQLMTEQNKATLTSMGILNSWADEYCKLYKFMLETMQTAPDKDAYSKTINDAIDQWEDTTKEIIVKNTTGITNEASQQKYANEFVKLYDNSWMRYFVSYDPKPTLEKLKCKVLALNGEKDIQVLPESNLAGIEAALKNSKSKDYTVKEIPGVNHLFQECTKCTVQEYAQLEHTIKPEVLDIITNWLDEHVK